MAGKTRKVGKPRALAMVICDAVLRDETTKKPTLVGLFNQITVSALPAIHDRVHVFVSLTNGHGEASCLLQCKAPSETLVCEVGGKITFEGPLDVADLNIELRQLVFEEWGQYVFDFYCDGELLAMRRFSVMKEACDAR